MLKLELRKLLLIDAGSLIYPAFHMLDLRTREGFPTGAIFGFIRTFLKILKTQKAQYIAVAFDSPGETFRHRKYKEYKANRPTMDEALAIQIPLIKDILCAFGVPFWEKKGLEADDLIAALTEIGKQHGLEVLIVSKDKDLMQLVDEKVLILKPPPNPRLDFIKLGREGVENYLGVPPEKVVDFLALVGDKVDNIPGVPGIGEKTAKELLQRFGSLDGILKNISSIKNKRTKESLQKHKESALVSRELVKLKGEASIKLEQCIPKEPDQEKLKGILENLEFRTILKELGISKNKGEKTSVEYHIIKKEEELGFLKEWAEFSLDLETTHQDPLRAEIVGIAISQKPFCGYYIPTGHSYPDAKNLPLDSVLDKLKPLLEDPDIKVIGQNLKYDSKVLRRYGIYLKGISFDSMLAAYLLEPTYRKGLEEIASRYLGYEMMSYGELGNEDISRVEIEKAARYSIEDAEVVWRLKDVLEKELKGKGLYELFVEVELPLIDVLVEMELKGMLLDPLVLEEQAKEIEILLENLREEILRLAGCEFNPSSPKQVAWVLFEKLKLPVIKKTKTGPSTDALVLKELSLKHPLPERILVYRELEKLLNTYIKKLPGHINPKTGRVHTTFNQSVTATGRLSASNPNLQNIPVRTELGGQIRKAFIAPNGRKLLAADYSQIELRMLAHFSGDEKLIDTFLEDKDMHTKTASEIFDVPQEEVDSQMREMAKRVNFGIVYGISHHRLAAELGIRRREAKRYIDKYFEHYPKVKSFISEKIKEAEGKGYVTTILGRRRYLPHIKSDNYSLRSYDQRNAINTPIQGSAADLMKLAMLRVHEEIKRKKLKADMILQIHDELLFEVDLEHLEESSELIKKTMEGVMELRVPLKVDIKAGDNWGEI